MKPCPCYALVNIRHGNVRHLHGRPMVYSTLQDAWAAQRTLRRPRDYMVYMTQVVLR